MPEEAGLRVERNRLYSVRHKATQPRDLESDVAAAYAAHADPALPVLFA